MGLKYTNFFENSSYESSDTQIVICKNCSSHLCLSHLILSDNFRGSTGPAYLVDKLINYQLENGSQETRMLTGNYLINKVKCHQCSNQLGWTYKKAFSYSETYKEGKFVIEKDYIKLIPNNSSTASLMEKAKLNNSRRRSSGSSSSSVDYNNTSDDVFKFNPVDPTKAKMEESVGNSSINFRDTDGVSILGRLRFQGIDKEEFDEDQDVFVDV